MLYGGRLGSSGRYGMLTIFLAHRPPKEGVMQISRTNMLPVQASATAKSKVAESTPKLIEAAPKAASAASPRDSQPAWKTARAEWQALDRAASTDAWLAGRTSWKGMRDAARAGDAAPPTTLPGAPTPTDNAGSASPVTDPVVVVEAREAAE
jgi:hypothetical protein